MHGYRLVAVSALLALALANQVSAMPSGSGTQLLAPAPVVDQNLEQGPTGIDDDQSEPDSDRSAKSPQGRPVDQHNLYDQPSHGDGDTDMEHRKHRTLGDDHD